MPIGGEELGLIAIDVGSGTPSLGGLPGSEPIHESKDLVAAEFAAVRELYVAPRVVGGGSKGRSV